eukprot:13724273-Alexandrium_andersonii.AAC.1
MLPLASLQRTRPQSLLDPLPQSISLSRIQFAVVFLPPLSPMSSRTAAVREAARPTRSPVQL